ncbi:MAG: membrane protein, partial [Anaerolineae bacterium]|nr:membrane protein [Anaerolineae bacterium]
MENRPRRAPLDLLVAVLLGAASFALYAVTLAPTVLVGDGGEFQFVPYLLGVAHPTGY